MKQATRNLGHTGITAMAISAVDNALWDLKARLLNIPLAKLLGQVKDKIAVYGSGGYTSYNQEQLKNQFEKWGRCDTLHGSYRITECTRPMRGF